MAFADFADDTGVVSLVIFPKLFASNAQVWRQDVLLVVTGKVDEREGAINILVDGVQEINTHEEEHNEGPITMRISARTKPATLFRLNQLLQTNQGDTELVLEFENGAAVKQIKLPYGVDWNPQLEQKINEILGK